MQWRGVFLASFLAASLSLLAQQPPPPASNVTIDVAVRDRAGKPVTGLQVKDFTLLEDKQAAHLTSARAVNPAAGTPAPPIEIILVLDAINASPMNMGRERDGVKAFLQRNGGKLPIPVSLVVVRDEGVGRPTLASQDGNALAAQLDQTPDGLRNVHRSTIYGNADRYQMSLKALDALAASEAAKPGRKLMIWVSPGWPLLTRAQSNITGNDQQHIFRAITRLSTELRVGHVTLYNIVARGLEATDVNEFAFYKEYLGGVKSAAQAYPPSLSLAVLAEQSGGLVLNGSNELPQAMAADIARSAADADSFYVLSFPAAVAEHPDEYHTIEVKVDKPGVTARTRTGYYAQP